MKYQKPKILAQGKKLGMAFCKPSTKPSGRPCNPPGPSEIRRHQ